VLCKGKGGTKLFRKGYLGTRLKWLKGHPGVMRDYPRGNEEIKMKTHGGWLKEGTCVKSSDVFRQEGPAHRTAGGMCKEEKES